MNKYREYIKGLFDCKTDYDDLFLDVKFSLSRTQCFIPFVINVGLQDWAILLGVLVLFSWIAYDLKVWVYNDIMALFLFLLILGLWIFRNIILSLLKSILIRRYYLQVIIYKKDNFARMKYKKLEDWGGFFVVEELGLFDPVSIEDHLKDLWSICGSKGDIISIPKNIVNKRTLSLLQSMALENGRVMQRVADRAPSYAGCYLEDELGRNRKEKNKIRQIKNITTIRHQQD